MSRTDDRIVAMKFDNVSFERNIKTTLVSLDKLQKSLDFSGSVRSMNDLYTAGRNFNLNGINTAVTTASKHIADLQTVGKNFNLNSVTTALSTSTRSVGDLHTAGKNFNLNGVNTALATSARSVADLQSAGKKFHLNDMASSVDGISLKFLAMSTVAITALSNITSQAISAAGRISKAFTIAPPLEGFREYETQLNSVQTILANTESKGTTLDQVNAALQKLNEYSDQTIYNFGQMAKNIGTFTAAGVDLNTSVNAIKGIANLSALSGSTAEQASSAMYQLSQAIATGTLRLIDWNSVNNAGIGGEVFKNALFETGKAMGKLGKIPMDQTFAQWEKANGSFRDSLEKGWITSDVLTTALSTFTGDLSEAQLAEKGFTQAQITNILKVAKTARASATEVKTFTQLMGTVKESIATGWADSFKLIIGNFTEAKDLWTKVNNFIGGFVKTSSDARTHLLEDWRKLGGRELLIDTFKDAFGVIAPILDRVKKAFRDIFPAMTGQRLVDITKALSKFLEKITITEATADKLRRVFAGVFAVLEIGWTVFKETIKFVGDLISAFNPKGTPIVDFAAKIGDALVAVNKFLVEGGGIRDFFAELLPYITDPIGSIKKLIEGFEGFQNTLNKIKNNQVFIELLDRIEARFRNLTVITDGLSKVWDRFGKIFDGLTDTLNKVWDKLSDWFSNFGKNLAKVSKPSDFEPALDLINIGLLGGIVLLLKRFLENGIKIDVGGSIFDKITGILDGVTEQLKTMQTNVKADTIMKIAIALGVLTAALVVLSLIDSEDLTKSLLAVAAGFAELAATMVVLSALSAGPKGAAKIGILGVAMIEMASAMVILAGAITILSKIDPADMARGLAGMGVALAIMVRAMTVMVVSPGQALAGATSMIALASSLVILAGAVKLFSMMSGEELAKGIGAITAALVGIGAAMNLFPVVQSLSAAAAMIPLAFGLTILAGVVKLFSMMSWEEMAKGMVGIAGGLTIIAVAMHAMPLTLPLTAAGLVLVGVALNLLAGAITIMSKMSWEEIGKGMVALAGGLLIIAAAMNLMPLTLPITAAGLILVGIALNIIAGAVGILGSMDMKTLAKGIGAVAAMLLILAIGTNAMNTALPGAAALVVISGALVILTGVLASLSQLGMDKVIVGLVALAGLFLVLGASAAVLTPVIPSLIGLAVALALLGGAFALVGVGALSIAKALGEFGKTGEAGITNMINAIKRFIAAIPDFFRALIQAFVGLSKEILEGTSLVLVFVFRFLDQLLDVVIKLVPKIVEALGVILSGFLKLAQDKAPELITTGFRILILLLKGIRDNAGEITALGLEILLLFLKGITDNIAKLTDAGIDIIVTLTKTIALRIGEVNAAGLDLLLALIRGIADNIFKVVETAIEIAITFVKTIANSAKDFIGAGADAIIEFVNGMTENTHKVAGAVTTLAVEFLKAIANNAVEFARGAADALISFLNGLATAIREKAPLIREAGWNVASAIVEGLIGGLSASDALRKVVNAAVNMAKGALKAVMNVFDVRSPSKVFAWIGKMLVKGLALGMDKDNTAANSAVAQAERVVSAFQKTLDRIPDSLAGMDEFQPVITPVLDLTKVKVASRGLSGLMAVPSIKPEVSFDQARLISNTTQPVSVEPDAVESSVPREVQFIQNNYSPKALSTGDIYRSTKSQIALAKKELSIP